jgi:signal transduction histidine kinase
MPANPNENSQKYRLAETAFDFFRHMTLPALIADRDNNLYLANEALAATFGYENTAAVESVLEHGEFLSTHFSPAVRAEFYEILMKKKRITGWLMRGEALDGRELALEISAQAILRSIHGPSILLKAVFVPPGEERDAEAFLKKARQEAELATKAKNEFLSNISHELRTPLNIIIGMLNLAVDDESLDEDLRKNLGLAKDGADRLFAILNDLIVLSNLEAGRLASDIAQFSPQLLLQTLIRQFSAKAEEKGVNLATETDDYRDAVLEGGYNFIVLAMEKLVHNAIKFVDDSNGRAVIRAEIVKKEDGPWLLCTVSDNGPGLDQSILDSQQLFHQGDASMIRKHGGLGLGLRLTKNLVSALGGHLNLANRPEGGAKFSFSIPIKLADTSDDL